SRRGGAFALHLFPDCNRYGQRAELDKAHSEPDLTAPVLLSRGQSFGFQAFLFLDLGSDSDSTALVASRRGESAAAAEGPIGLGGLDPYPHDGQPVWPLFYCMAMTLASVGGGAATMGALSKKCQCLRV